MRQDSAAFNLANESLSKDPRHVVEVAFDEEATDLVYITSHDDAPLPSSVTSYDGLLSSLSATSQHLRPEKANASIGNINFAVTDLNQTIRKLLASKFVFGRSLKAKRIRSYLNFKGNAWSDAALVQTQIIDKIETLDGSYSFKCSDVQRILKKKIFILADTTLQSSIGATDTTINVYDTSRFEIVAHGSSYSDAPNQSVYYFKIEKEIIRATGKTSTTFTGCTRGVLNTKAVAHNINPSASPDRRTKVEEVVYLEMPAVKMAYALLTGIIYGQGANLPANWHAAVPVDYVRDTSFTSIGEDLWNTTDDTKGVVLRFVGEKNQEAKKFIEEQLLLPMGCYLPIHADGAFGLKRMVQILADAPYVAELNVDNLTNYSVLKHDLPDIKNVVDVFWNYEPEKGEETRHHLMIDQTSIDIYKTTSYLDVKFRGLHGSIHTSKTIDTIFERLRDRFTSEPLRITVSGFFSLNNIEIGDIVKLNLPNVQDYIKDDYLNRAFEVQRVAVDWITGRVTFNLFGSTAKTIPTVLSDSTTVINDSWYSTEGADISTLAGYSAGSLNSNITLNGDANLNNDAAIYYHIGDLIIPDGVTITINQNVQLRIMGYLTINGKINGKGLAGVGSGFNGYVGAAKPQGGMRTHWYSRSATSVIYPFDSAVTPGLNSAVPELNLSYNTNTNLLAGLPGDLRGTTGTNGGNITNLDFGSYAAGGAFGNAGAGLLIVDRGLGFGVSGSIDLSGNNGSVGNTYVTNEGYTLTAGGGAGGSPGSFYNLLDGSTAIATIGSQNLILERGGAPLRSCCPPYTSSQGGLTPYQLGDRDGSSYYIGFPAADLWQSYYRVQYVPDDVSTEEDLNAGALPAPTLLTALSGADQLLTQQDGTIIPRVLLTFAAAIDARIVGYEVQYKLNSETRWITSTNILGAESDETYVMGVVSGSVYDFRLRSASSDGNTSEWLEELNHTVIGKSEPPASVGSFDAYQNGSALVMKWPAVGDVDLAGYEIRYLESSGSGLWNDAIVLTAVTKGTNVTTVDIPDGNWLMMIKAVDTSGNYSVNAATRALTFSSNFNVISTAYFEPDFTGTLTNFVWHYTGKLVPKSQNLASADGWETFDQAIVNPYADCYFEVAEYDNGFDDESRVSAVITSALAPGETTGVADPYFEVDTRLAAGSYDGFERWGAGNVEFRYLKSRIHLDASKGLAIISGFTRIVDALEWEQKAESVTISSSGEAITFPVPYHLAPHLSILVLSSTATLVTVSAKSATQFTVNLFDTTGAAVAGTIDWTAKGV